MSELNCTDCQALGFKLEEAQVEIRELNAAILAMEREAREEVREAEDRAREEVREAEDRGWREAERDEKEWAR